MRALYYEWGKIDGKSARSQQAATHLASDARGRSVDKSLRREQEVSVHAAARTACNIQFDSIRKGLYFTHRVGNSNRMVRGKAKI